MTKHDRIIRDQLLAQLPLIESVGFYLDLVDRVVAISHDPSLAQISADLGAAYWDLIESFDNTVEDIHSEPLRRKLWLMRQESSLIGEHAAQQIVQDWKGKPLVLSAIFDKGFLVYNPDAYRKIVNVHR